MTDKSRIWADDDPRRKIDRAPDRARTEADTLLNGPATGRGIVDTYIDRRGGPARRGPAADDHGWSDPTPDEALGGAHLTGPAAETTKNETTKEGTTHNRTTQNGTIQCGTTTAAPSRHRPGPRGMGHVAEHHVAEHHVAEHQRQGADHQRADHQGDDWWRVWLRRTSIALLATLALATALVWAWVGGLHSAGARDVPVAVIAGDVGAINAIQQSDKAVRAVGYRNARDADDALARRKVSAILATDSTSPLGGLNLAIAGAAGPGVADAVTNSITATANANGIPLTIVDIHPTSGNDPDGRTPFFLMMAWVLGGLLAAIVLGVALGTVPRDLDRVAMRLAALAVFALLLGLFGALLAGPILGIWGSHTFGLWMSGTLIIFTAALIASALQSWLGMWGIGLSTVLLLVLGLPGSGGLVGFELLPGFFRGMHSWIPTGLGTDLIRGVEYFGRNANTWPITGLTLWSLASMVALIAATVVLGRGARERAATRAAAVTPAVDGVGASTPAYAQLVGPHAR